MERMKEQPFTAKVAAACLLVYTIYAVVVTSIWCWLWWEGRKGANQGFFGDVMRFAHRWQLWIIAGLLIVIAIAALHEGWVHRHDEKTDTSDADESAPEVKAAA